MKPSLKLFSSPLSEHVLAVSGTEHMVDNTQNRIDPPEWQMTRIKQRMPVKSIMRAAIVFQRAMTNLVWGELQDASSRTSQPHIGSDGAGNKAIPLLRQGPGQDFVAKTLECPPCAACMAP